MDLFIEFRGRKPKIDALLRHTGLLDDMPPVVNPQSGASLIA
jgi:oligopeptidase A